MAWATSPAGLLIGLLLTFFAAKVARSEAAAAAAEEPYCDAVGCAGSAAQAQPDISSLLQVGLASVSTKRGAAAQQPAPAPAPAPAPQQDSMIWCANQTGYSDLGPPTTAEQHSFMAWAFEQGENGGPAASKHLEDLDKPLTEVVTNLSAGETGNSHFGFCPGVDQSVRLGTWIPFAVGMVGSLDHNYSLKQDPYLSCPSGYSTSYMMTTPFMPPLCAEQCTSMGFLDFPIELLSDFDSVNGAAAQQCEDIRQEFELAGLLGNATMRALMDQFDRNSGMMTGQIGPLGYRWHYLLKCLLSWPYGLAADIAFCRYNYCYLPDGRMGGGDQCRPDFLKESDRAQFASHPVGRC